MVPAMSEAEVRPTLRCLSEDLAPDASPASRRSEYRSAKSDGEADIRYLLPHTDQDFDHPILGRAVQLVADPAAQHEVIQAVPGERLVKVKSGQLRGALWREGDIWWLVASGWRKDGDQKDFYASLDRLSGFDMIAPTSSDRRCLVYERAYLNQVEAERSAQELLLGAVFEAAGGCGRWATADVFGNSVWVRVIPDDGDLAVVEVSWVLGDFKEQDRFPYDVLAMVPGLEDIGCWDYLPARAGEDAPVGWIACVSQAWVHQLATSVEIEELLGDGWSPPVPQTDGSENFSHYAKKKVVTLAYCTGVEIVGLCGARIVAHRDFTEFPLCPECEHRLALLRP